MPFSWISAAIAAFLLASASHAQDRYIGEIIMGGWTFCPQPFSVPADGQMLSVSDHQALFSLYGTTYGGDGRTTFGLPDLRGRAPVHAGTGPGLAPSRLGTRGGNADVTLGVENLPPHSHDATATAQAATTPGATPNPAGNLPALTTTAPAYAAPGGSTTAMAPGGVDVSLGNTGGGQAISVRDPFQVIQFCVVIDGIYPSRS